ncbi:RNA-directed DNA polymerase, eukaryota [Tanacetum coccineum]
MMKWSFYSHARINVGDYVNLLCGLNITLTQIEVITRSSTYDCNNPTLDVNYPSFIASFSENEILHTRGKVLKVFQRTITSVENRMSVYKATLTGLKGFNQDLWKVCNDYGTIVDVFIPFKKSKAGKRFAFVRFIKVKELDRLVENLCTIWIGRFHIHANAAQGSLPPVKEVVNSEPSLVLDDTCIKEHDFSLSLMGKVKTVSSIPNLPIILLNEGFHNIKITYLGVMWVLFAMDSLESKDKLLNHTGVNSWFLTIKEAYNSFVYDERITWVSIEGLPIKAWTINSFRKIASLWGEIVEWEDSNSFALSNKPLCLKTKIDVSINERRKIIIQEDIIGENFVGNKDKIDSSDIDRVSKSSFSHANDLVHDTSNNNVIDHIGEQVQSLSSKLKERNLNGGVSSHHSKNSCSSKNKAGGSILEVMDEIVKVGQTMGYNMEGGILCVWDARVFTKEHVSKSDYFVAIMGTWVPTSTKLLVISFYAPQEITEKQDLWYYLRSLIESQGANAFNNFISLAGLIDLPLEGYTYTWAHKSAYKMSKLDRFLISDGLLLSFPHLSAICLDRHLSDHRPILLKENSFDFGPTPFRIFHSWFSMEGFDSFVETTWKSMNVLDSNGLVRMKKKLQLLKTSIKVWIKEARVRSNEIKNNIHQNLSEVDKIIDQVLGNDEVIHKRTNLLKDLQELNSLDATYISQKDKIHWTIEGDENTKYFHGSLNKKISQLAIRGTLVNGEWISDLDRVDVEKAFDSVRWDYILDTLKAFGFGQKWCKWINGCFDTAMGSVLVNGNPTSKFQFHKGLKKGDPISPFLFILIMETLHLSFNRVIDANLFKGISINASFLISHLFYADDVVFVGEWRGSNFKSIDKVEMATNLVGCSTFTSLFKYLGVKVGDNMLRLNSWDEVISKVSNRLSNWKLKTLSISGRLTLIKLVLSSIPLYHMSIFKAPMGVLNKLESIRRNFFNGTYGLEKKNLWIGWDKILASKKHSGLGVSSMHDNHGALTSRVSSLRRSPWLDIIRDIHSFNSKGIDLMKFLKKRIRNCENTSFWDDKWLDDEAFMYLFPRLSARIYIDENILPKVNVPTRWVKIIPIKVNIHAWKWNLHTIFSSLVPWLDKFGAKFCVGGRWMLPLLISNRSISGRPMMKFESGYNVETVFDGSKLGIEPHAIEVLPNGELLVLDSANSNLYKISSSLSLYSRLKLVAGSADGYFSHVDGRLREAKMIHPKGLIVDDKGNIYVADTDNMAIRKINDTWVTTIAGGKAGRRGHVDGPSEDAKFSNDFDVLYIGSSCSLLVIDRGNQAIREIQLPFDDCAYQYGSSFPLGIAVLVAAGLFGYMLALLQRRVGSMISNEVVRDDVIKFRYRDKQHLDEALKRILQYGLGSGVARRNAPVLKKIRKEVTEDVKYCLVLVFEAKALELADFEKRQLNNNVPQQKFATFFGPGIIAEVGTREEQNMFDVCLISDTTL